MIDQPEFLTNDQTAKTVLRHLGKIAINFFKAN